MLNLSSAEAREHATSILQTRDSRRLPILFCVTQIFLSNLLSHLYIVPCLYDIQVTEFGIFSDNLGSSLILCFHYQPINQVEKATWLSHYFRDKLFAADGKPPISTRECLI